MINKKILIIMTIIVISTTLLFLFLEKNNGVNASNEKTITKTEVVSFVKEIDPNIDKVINIGKKTNTKSPHKNITKELDIDSKELMSHFFAEMKDKSFDTRFKAIARLVEQNINLIEYRKKIYDLIINETDSHLRRELITIFFDMYSPNNHGEIFKPTKEQHEETKGLVLKMILNQKIKDEVIGREFRLLSADEIENIYSQYQNEFSDEHKSALINSYINNTVLSGKDPYSSNLSKEVEQYISKEKLKKRTQDMLGVLAKSSDGSDVTGGSDFLKEQLEEPIAGTDPLHYVLWMQARVTTFSSYQQKAQFINTEFNKISQPYKHEFILRMSTYTPMVDNLYAYLLNRKQELLQILMNVIRIDDPKVFKVLTEFRAIFLFSKNNNLRQGIDKIVKELIDKLPDYEVSLDILKFIKEEEVYIANSYFNVDQHIQRISNNMSTKKK